MSDISLKGIRECLQYVGCLNLHFDYVGTDELSCCTFTRRHGPQAVPVSICTSGMYYSMPSRALQLAASVSAKSEPDPKGKLS